MLKLLQTLLIISSIKAFCIDMSDVIDKYNSLDEKSKTEIIVTDVKPDNFKCDVDCVFCYVFAKDRLLLLKNASHKFEAFYWGVPGGKIEKNESIEHALLRELFEETSLDIDQKQLTFATKLYMQKPIVQYTFNMYFIELDEIPPIKISREHMDYDWVYPEDIESKKIMTGGIEALNYLLKIRENHHQNKKYQPLSSE